jgi:hypothetical protein
MALIILESYAESLISGRAELTEYINIMFPHNRKWFESGCQKILQYL